MLENNNITIFAQEKRIGVVKGNTFYKTIARNHFLRKPPAIASDVDSLFQAEQAGAVWVQVKDRETGVVYRATIAHIRKAGFHLNRGYGVQIALPLSGWIISKRGGGLQLAFKGVEVAR